MVLWSVEQVLMFSGGDAIFPGTEQNMKFIFSVLTYLTHLKDGNIHRLLLKNKTATMFFLKKPFSS